MNRQITAGLVALVACSGSAFAGALLDGQRDAAYGAPLVVQSVGTQFGNSNLGQIGFANGSELNAAYCFTNGDRLNLFFSGNLESNFNKLELFIDYRSGGQNQLRGDNADVDFNGLNRQGGLTFDAGFEPDLYFTMTGGDAGGGNYQRFANWAELLSGGGGAGNYLGQGGAGVGGLSGGGPNPFGFDLAIDNSNTLGVGNFGSPNDSDPASVITGMEISLSLSALGLASADGVKIAVFINGGGHDFVSNQVLGGLPAGTQNLGEPSAINFNQFAGNQFVVLPTPGAAALLGLAGLAATRRRRA